MWRYGGHFKLNEMDGVDQVRMASADIRPNGGPFIYLLGIMISLVNAHISVIIYSLALGYYIIVSNLSFRF